MTSKQRVHAALEGKPVDRTPVTVLYQPLYHLDHFAELTGKAEWEWRNWRLADPDEHLATFQTIMDNAPLEILQPQPAASRQERERIEYVERAGTVFRHDKREDTYELIEVRSGHAFDDLANQTQYVFNKEDAKQQIRITSAEELIARGANDYIEAIAQSMGSDNFVLTGGLVSTLYACQDYLGLTNVLLTMAEQPDLIEYMTNLILEQNIEVIRQYAQAGGDAIYIDVAFSTNDLISVAHYERFIVPHLQAMVDEIHRLDHKCILIYFGGVADRLEQIVAAGADGVSVETSMKGYRNDIGEIAAAIGERVSLFGNIDPVGVLQKGSDEQLEAEIYRQVEAGRQARGFII